MDVSTTMIVKPGPVLNFLMENQNVKTPYQIDWIKLGGINSLLMVEHCPSLPLVSKSPTLILGMDVSHGSPGRSDVPSIAAVTKFQEMAFDFSLPSCSSYSITKS